MQNSYLFIYIVDEDGFTHFKIKYILTLEGEENSAEKNGEIRSVEANRCRRGEQRAEGCRGRRAERGRRESLKIECADSSS